MPKLCADCVSSNLTLTHTGTRPIHTKSPGDLPRQSKAVPSVSFTKGSHPADADLVVRIRTPLKPGTRVLYWGARACGGLRKVVTRPVSKKPDYGAYANYGTTRVGRDQRITMRLCLPVVYCEKGVGYPRHVHFCIENKKKEWGHRVWAAGAFPSAHAHGGDVTPKELHSAAKLGKLHVVNALPIGYRGIDCPHIRMDRAHHIPHTLPQHVFDRFVHTHALQVEPVVVYCLKPECGAAKKAIAKLTKAGACNVFYMPAGTNGWYSYFKTQ